MEETRVKYYPAILQAIHLLILYIFIQTVVDFPLALIDYFKDTEYLYNPFKKVILGVGSTLFILYFGFKKSKAPLNEVFPLKFFNPLVIIPIVTFFLGMHNMLNEVNGWVDKLIPPPSWFWELFNNIFESDFGWWGAFFKVAIIAPVVEELIFRGLILQGFRKNYHPAVAILMSALLFALYHLNPWQFPATFMLGLLLGWLVIRTNNIILAIIGHSINNFLVLASMTWWDKIKDFPVLSMEKQKLFVLSAVIVLLSVILIYFTSINWFKRK